MKCGQTTTPTSTAWRAAVIERLVLVGFMYSGKSSVGRLLADRLGWEFLDFDEIIEHDQSRRISDIFRQEGEAHFRSIEAELTRRLEDRRKVVMAPGGGWVTQPDLVERLREGSLIVWLRVQPETIYARHQAEQAMERPLLEVEDPLAAIRVILAARTPLYEGADAVVDTDARAPEDVAEEIAGLFRERVTRS